MQCPQRPLLSIAFKSYAVAEGEDLEWTNLSPDRLHQIQFGSWLSSFVAPIAYDSMLFEGQCNIPRVSRVPNEFETEDGCPGSSDAPASADGSSATAVFVRQIAASMSVSSLVHLPLGIRNMKINCYFSSSNGSSGSKKVCTGYARASGATIVKLRRGD